MASGGPGVFVLALTGAMSLARGMIIDLRLLDRILQDEVLSPFAGKHLNLDLPAYTFPHIAARLPAGLVLERVRIMEDPTLYADCTGVT